MSIKIDTRAFDRSLKKLEKQVIKALEKAMDKSINKLEEESKKLAPFKEGDLVNSSTKQIKSSSTEVLGTVQYNVPYAAYQHNALDLIPGPGTREKSSTKYGNPGPNYLLNPAEGLGKDKVYHENIEKEWKDLR